MKRRHILILVAIAAMCMAGCGPRAPAVVTELADQFFGHLRQGDTAAAYAMLAEASRQETGSEEFRQAAEALGFIQNRGVKWDEPYIDDDYAKIVGVITTRSGEPLAQELVFFKKARKWELHMVRDVSDEGEEWNSWMADNDVSPPTPEEALKLATDTLQRLIDSIVSGDYEVFHAETARDLRENTTPGLFQESFGWLGDSEAGLDWAAIRSVPPELDPPPVLNSNGVLLIAGQVPQEGKDLVFQLQYVFEDPVWRLLAIDIRPPL